MTKATIVSVRRLALSRLARIGLMLRIHIARRLLGVVIRWNMGSLPLRTSLRCSSTDTLHRKRAQ